MARDCIEEYKKKRSEWLRWIDGEGVHSIWSQLLGLAERLVIYRCFEESLTRARNSGDGGHAISDTFAYFVCDCFFESQAAGVRRLLDKGRNKDVVSLRRLLNELKAHAELLTRHNMLAAAGLPYDYERLKDNDKARAPKDNQARLFSGSDGWGAAERLHGQIDKLCDLTSNGARSPEDRVSDRIFCSLQKHVDDAGCGIKTVVDKFVAHAADKESRKKLGTEHTKLSFEGIEVAVKSLCEVTSFVKSNILCGAGGALFPPSGDPCGIIAPPLVAEDHATCLRQFYETYKRQVDRWYSAARPDFLKSS